MPTIRNQDIGHPVFYRSINSDRRKDGVYVVPIGSLGN